jgi:hypothetical protein
MSLQTWKDEFYPIHAFKAVGSELEAAKHSLRKWIGLRKENLEKHGLERKGREISSTDFINFPFSISESSCALCQYHDGYCNDCILYTLGNGCEEEGSEYIIWVNEGDPEPMIKALEEAIKVLAVRDES